MGMLFMYVLRVPPRGLKGFLMNEDGRGERRDSSDLNWWAVLSMHFCSYWLYESVFEGMNETFQQQNNTIENHNMVT